MNGIHLHCINLTLIILASIIHLNLIALVQQNYKDLDTPFTFHTK